MSDIQENLFQQYIDERLGQYEKLFGSPLWKKSLQPFLKAHWEIAVREIFNGRDVDVQRGRGLAFESLINLPKAVEYRQNNKTMADKSQESGNYPGPITDYDDDYTPEWPE